MLLRNFYNIMAAHTLNVASIGGLLQFGEGFINTKNTRGEIVSIERRDPSLARIDSIYNSGLATAGNTYIRFGSGTTPVTFEDYKLAENVSGLSASNIITTKNEYDIDTEKFVKEVTFLMTNSNAEEKTITEVGILFNSWNSSTSELTLVYREVLENPFTIAAGDSVRYTHKFEFTMPTI